MVKFASWLTRCGGGVSCIAFFLPWVSFSCAGEIKSHSGLSMAQEQNEMVWIVLVCGALLLLVSFLAGRHAFGFLLTILISLTGIGILLVQYFQQVHEAEVELEAWGHTLEAIGVQLQPGAYGTLGGFVLGAVAGILGLKATSTPEEPG